jgi:pyruvate/2-oxoglutarate dehydrogenase complex dihydrolipoamide dehydrogenase (E3) component
VPNLPGIGEVPFLTNSTILKLDRVPEHLVVVGGGYVGLESAQMYRRFGARVTVVEMGPRLIGREDEDVSQAIRDILEGEGIAVRTGAECITLARHADGIAVGVQCSEGDPEVIGSDVLLAVGRRPNTDDLGLEFGHSAIATAGVPSRIRPTMISRSSPPTCSTVKRGGSATASWAMHSTSIRRSVASV